MRERMCSFRRKAETERSERILTTGLHRFRRGQ